MISRGLLAPLFSMLVTPFVSPYPLLPPFLHHFSAVPLSPLSTLRVFPFFLFFLSFFFSLPPRCPLSPFSTSRCPDSAFYTFLRRRIVYLSSPSHISRNWPVKKTFSNKKSNCFACQRSTMTRRGEDRLDLFHERKFDANLVVRFNFYFRSRGRRKKKK